MPRKLPVACALCGNRECGEHQRREERENAGRRGYDGRWRRLRRLVLAEEPLCRHCREQGRITPAVHVHHVKPIRTSPTLRLVRSNLVPLCAPCHNRINDYA
jgi:5-methylcytosine-specific restriction protein A